MGILAVLLITCKLATFPDAAASTATHEACAPTPDKVGNHFIGCVIPILVGIITGKGLIGLAGEDGRGENGACV